MRLLISGTLQASTKVRNYSHQESVDNSHANQSKPRKLEPLNHKVPTGRNNLAGLRLPANYSGKWRDWNEPDILGINDLYATNKRSL